ncbi:LCCL domain-containing protein [Roseomonas sp. CECT 9278]|uniref:LCCL domain-containing protein n=1 Tax=Roseomonas sp. CECT 9278 TaxID=2845823 RepID=UPI001E4FCE21|nr:LCCL domain-containing protein [Roseomonas sp. CECT 9278]CAH0237992.1 hypothetical protein ROS9278_02818 [Roseomonas sp. CECT 9278]
MRRLILAIGGVLALAGTASAQAPCPPTFEGRTAALTCTCSAEAAQSGAVWGSGIYTSDSRICRAAVHAGVIPASGGPVGVEPAPGRQSYDSERQNGITTQAFGPWRSSFTFGMPTVAPMPNCPANFEGRTEALACLCNAALVAAGSVWGTGVYSSDSQICRAALHAGLVGLQGGAIGLVPRGRQAQFTGSRANGVTSMNFGPWGGSFSFTR